MMIWYGVVLLAVGELIYVGPLITAPNPNAPVPRLKQVGVGFRLGRNDWIGMYPIMDTNGVASAVHAPNP